MDIVMRGNGRVEQYKGNIVGFSNRLNTILVPQSFMEWANQAFASEKEAQPSRLIVEVKNPTDTAITDYFNRRTMRPKGTIWMPERPPISSALSQVLFPAWDCSSVFSPSIS